MYSNCVFFSHLHYVWLHLSKMRWRFFCIAANRFLFILFPLCDSMPPALHFVVLDSHKVPLDTSAVKLCNFSHQEDICNRVEELVLTQFLLIYYLSSQVLPQTFITLASTRLWFDTDNTLFFGSACKNSHAWMTPSWKYNLGEIFNSARSEW